MTAKDANNIGDPTSCSLGPHQQRRTIMMTPTRTTLITALLVPPASPQQPPPLGGPPLGPLYDPMPVMIPLPPQGCVWAGRPFSDGAGFCVADKILQTWTI